jgi:hypothetical protein
MSKLTPTTGFVKPGEIFVCNCGIPLARKTLKGGYDLVKFYNGKQVSIEIKFDGMLEVHCPVCRRGFAHLIVRESTSMNDSVKIVVESAKT